MIELITAAELAQVLHLPVPQIWTLVRRGQIVFYKVGRLYRFNLEAVLSALEQGAGDDR
jgi:excisionase family DNA binding protein